MNLVKEQHAIYRQDVFIVTISRNQVDKIIDQFYLSKSINVSFNLIENHQSYK